MSKHNGKATASLVLGIISLVMWLIPLFGFPVSIIGMIMGFFGAKSEKKTIGIVGLVLSIIGLIICIVNAVMGAYMGATGQLF